MKKATKKNPKPKVELKLKAKKRNLFGRKVKKLRRQGLVPAVVYGHNFDSLAIQFPVKELKIVRQAGETSVIYLEVDNKQIPVMIKQVQYHPVTGSVLHVDFYKVNLKEKVTAEVPIELVGEAPIAKEGYNVVQVLQEVSVSALPTEVPKEITVDISGLTQADQDIRLKDLVLPSKEIEFAEGVDLEETVVVVEKQAEEEVEETPSEEEGEEEKKEETETQTKEKEEKETGENTKEEKTD